MSIELDRNVVALRVKNALAERLIEWRRNSKPEIGSLIELMTEVMWEVAAMTKQATPERGILAGVKMIETWED